MTWVRTVLGDVEPSALGVTYAHEHLVIDGGRPVEMHPDFLLAELRRQPVRVGEARALGLAAVVDAMPADAGRNATMLADLSRRTGIHVVASTGLHHDRYYGPAHWRHRLSEDELADLFVADVEEGIDVHDYSGPIVRRTPHRAGVVKVAGSEGGPSAQDARVFRAAAETHRRTGAPILTHCEHGTGAPEQVRLLVDAGVNPGHVVLSHVDKIVDLGYHRELLAAGAVLEYDQAFRWPDRERGNGTLRLLVAMIEAGFGDRIVLGMDAARQGYYRAYGGEPGLRYLLGEFSAAMDAAGIDAGARRRLFVDNPARAFAFAPRDTGPEAQGGRP